MADAIICDEFKSSDLPKADQSRLSHLNVGTGVDVTIKELAETIKKILALKVGFRLIKVRRNLRKLWMYSS